MNSGHPKILVIRRDNIGDLVCTTPVFSALRIHFPGAKICALVNSYNVAVLENNSDIDAVYVYTKAKHRPPGKNIAVLYWERISLFLKLRRERFDYAILAGSLASVPRALMLARIVHPQHIIGYVKPDSPEPSGIDLPVPYQWHDDAHEVEETFGLLAPLHVPSPPPPLRVLPNESLVKLGREKLAVPPAQHLVGIHISARKYSQRWPASYFIELVKELTKIGGMAFLLFWSPGDENNPLHPGDDRKAEEILSAVAGLPVIPYPTHQLQELIGGLSLCSTVICSDGGAMHLAAGLGKPILCFFGKSSPTRWRPWGAPHILIQPSSQNVIDISVADALNGFIALQEKVRMLSC